LFSEGANVSKQAKTVALYLRVSTCEQTVQNQRIELQAAADRAGWQIVGEYADEGISGSKGRDQRPAFDLLLKDAARRKFDMIAAISVDRLGRSMPHLVAFLNEIHAVGVDLFLLRQGLDTTTPTGRAMFQMSGVFAEWEREIIAERVRSGMARAKAAGKRMGRPKVSKEMERRIIALRAQGKGILATARAAGCGASTVQRVIAEAA
jgi:DNA invertase Pin-like site-specific DNA recombinase